MHGTYIMDICLPYRKHQEHILSWSSWGEKHAVKLNCYIVIKLYTHHLYMHAGGYKAAEAEI